MAVSVSTALLFKNVLCLYIWLCDCYSAWTEVTEVRGQRLRVGSLLSPSGFQELNSDCRLGSRHLYPCAEIHLRFRFVWRPACMFVPGFITPRLVYWVLDNLASLARQSTSENPSFCLPNTRITDSP